MALSDKQVVMITQIDDEWVWKFVVAGDHGVVREGDGACATRDAAVAAALQAHPDAEVLDVDSPGASY